MNASTSCDRLWRKRLDELSAVWPDFVQGRTTGLHKTRVASRRIREALPIVGIAASHSRLKKLSRKMRALTRALGPIRELDVELGILEEKKAYANGVSGRALDIVRREIASRRQALREELNDDAPVTDIKRLLRKLERIVQGKESRRAKDDHAAAKSEIQLETKWRALLAARLMQRARRLAMALEDAGPIYAPERLHDVRISTKKMRYSLEIARDAGVPGATPLLKILKRHQERLGQLHDLQVLRKRVRETEATGLGSGTNDLTDYADSLDWECRRLHAAFVENRGDLSTVVKLVRQQIVPALTTPRRHLSAVARSAKVEARVNSTRRTVTHARAK